MYIPYLVKELLVGCDFLQLHANCLDDVIYHVELVPTYSSGPSLNLSNTTQFGQTLLTLSSEEVTFNEYYKATVRIQGFPRFQHHLTLSMFDIFASIIINNFDVTYIYFRYI